MPVRIDSSRSSHDRQGSTLRIPRGPQSPFAERPDQSLRIGLINNMPEAAFRATERQFVSLLDAASESISIRLSLYTLPGMLRTESGEHHAGSGYSSVDALWDTHLDGLIVTGREPMTPNLEDEPYWECFTEVLEWARENTYSTVWSCLAAHAAVLHMDGIRRRRSDEKHFGLFECTRVADHSLTAGAPRRFPVPHSRWNGVAEEELTACGYEVLTRTAKAGVDAFLKQENSLFVFLQGHPEYDADTLLREYRRDVGRYLRQHANAYPLMPGGYFDKGTEHALTDLREEAVSHRNHDLLAKVSSVLGQTTVENTWQRPAARIYRNWLEHLSARKAASHRERPVKVA